MTAHVFPTLLGIELFFGALGLECGNSDDLGRGLNAVQVRSIRRVALNIGNRELAQSCAENPVAVSAVEYAIEKGISCVSFKSNDAIVSSGLEPEAEYVAGWNAVMTNSADQLCDRYSVATPVLPIVGVSIACSASMMTARGEQPVAKLSGVPARNAVDCILIKMILVGAALPNGGERSV